MVLQLSRLVAIGILSYALTACSSSSDSSTGGTSGQATTGGTTTTGGTSTAGTTGGTTTAGTTGGTTTAGTTGGTDSGTTGGTTGGNGNNDTSAIAGLWDFSDDFGDGVVDVYYLEIRSNGTATEWDYDGDTFDQGDNCYFRFDVTVTNLGGGQYNYDGTEITAQVSNGVLIVSGDFGTDQLPALNGVSSTDFNECP